MISGHERMLEALIDVTELRWMDRALCAETDPEAFYPEKGGSTEAAKAVCRACPVRPECLDYALRTQQKFGIWGGLSENGRRPLMRLYAREHRQEAA